MEEVSEGAVEAPSDRKRTEAARSRAKRERWRSSVSFTTRSGAWPITSRSCAGVVRAPAGPAQPLHGGGLGGGRRGPLRSQAHRRVEVADEEGDVAELGDLHDAIRRLAQNISWTCWRCSSAGWAGATSAWGEVSEGAVEAPSDRKRTDASRSRTKRETWPSSVTFTMRVV